MLALTLPTSLFASDVSENLERDFKNPPAAALPRTWWHWTNSNVTKDGITKDLEWMKRVGIGGFQLADVAAGGGQTVEKKIIFGTPEWFDAVRHAASEADRLGLEMTIFASPGWSETGGPWVKPEQAMKKFVWSETNVEGPQHFTGKLPQPPSNNGPYQNVPLGGSRSGTPPDPTFYGDSAVIAYRTPAEEKRVVDLKPEVTVNGKPSDNASALFDEDLTTTLTIPAPADGGAATVQFAFTEPFQARAITLGGPGGIPVGRVLASEDGKTFHTVVTLPGAQLYRQGKVRTFAFPQTTARFFRIELTGAPLGPAATMSQEISPPAKQYTLSEATLYSGARIHRWEEKVGFSFLFEYESVPTPIVPHEAAIPSSNVLDVSSKMAPDGTLDWDAPPGRWTILRLGYSLTGAKNRPAIPAALGYEVDKLSRKHTEAYFHGYVDSIAGALGPLFGKSLQYLLMDSWEAGMQNWTEDMLSQFQKRRGYDPSRYLPALTGHVVESAEVSDRFLWDFRRTLADMFSEHFGTMTELLHQRGLGSYGEVAGVSLEIPEDTLLNKSKVDIPMAEFWTKALHPDAMYFQDVRGAASAAHIYGKKLVATESFTGGGYESPATMKNIADHWFAQGVNRIIFHTSAHQPLDTKPGNTMVGMHINRNITWAEQAAPLMTYLARNSFMLQQGLYVADLAYLLPEGAPSTMPFWGSGLQPSPPQGYNYDYINADVLLHRMSVNAQGQLILPDGMTYRALVLPETNRMTLPVLRKIHELVSAGAIVVGPTPTNSPSLAEYPETNHELQELTANLWGDLDGKSRTKHSYGKGTVIWGLPLTEVLSSFGIPKDFESSQSLDATVPWIHRRTGDADIYFLVNHTDCAQELEARFRVNGKAPALFHPDSGTVEPAEYTIANDLTTMPLRLTSHEAVFVVFRQAASAPSRTLPKTKLTSLVNVAGPWELGFPPNLGAPAKVKLPALTSWTTAADEGVKYFSGTATYTKTLDAPIDCFGNTARLLLDLGTVNDVAEVTLNAQKLGILWKPPYQVEVTGVLKPGANQLEIQVTNEWTNRIIGDRSSPPDKKVLSSPGPTIKGFGEADTLKQSGLMGPVTIKSVTSDAPEREIKAQEN